jgi:hypothetical protein
MKKYLALIVVLLTLSFIPAAESQVETDVKVALAIAKAKALAVAPVSESAPDFKEYGVAREKAIKEHKNLIVWVGYYSPLMIDDLSDFVHVAVSPDLFGRGKDKEILVGKYFNNELWIVPGIETTDLPPTIKSKVEAYKIALSTQGKVEVQQPVFSGTIIQGCSGGQCGVGRIIQQPVFSGQIRGSSSGCANGQCPVK